MYTLALVLIYFRYLISNINQNTISIDSKLSTSAIFYTATALYTSLMLASFLFGKSPPKLDFLSNPDIAAALSTLTALENEATTQTPHKAKTITQLERILFNFESNLKVLVTNLSPAKSKDFNKKEKTFLASQCNTYMVRAESIKALLVTKKSDREESRMIALYSTSAPILPSKPPRSTPNSSSSITSIASSNINSRQHPHPTPPPASNSYSTNRSSANRRRLSSAPPLPSSSSPSISSSTELEKTIVTECKMEASQTRFDDIAGLHLAKVALQEAVILPKLRPDIFTGLRAPPKGVLLFGPPGTGKTMIARACACESGFNFFAVSASSLTSKWVGEGEKMMKALFKVARDFSPSVVFFDEVDSLLSKRKSTGEHEASRRMKSEFLTQVDGINIDDSISNNNSSNSSKSKKKSVTTIACTNLPWDLDDAALRRFARRIFIGLPDEDARFDIVKNLLAKNNHNLSKSDLKSLVKLLNGYSASDITNICKEASMGPLRQLSVKDLADIDLSKLSPITITHFKDVLQNNNPTVSKALMKQYDEWCAQSA